MICFNCNETIDRRTEREFKLEAVYRKIKGRRFIRFQCPNCGRKCRLLIGGIALEDSV